LLNKKSIKMKTIIVPTDFSDNSENALTYACELNKKWNAKILLLHCYNVLITVSDAPEFLISAEEIRKTAVDGLRRIKSNYETNYPGMLFETEAIMGMADDEIVNTAKKNNSELIVMGTHGASGLGEFLIGTNTATVTEKALCPVLAIPEKATFTGLKNIVFAADYGNHNFSHMHYIIDLAKIFDAEIILLHITSGKLEDNFEDLEIGRFKEQIIKESGYKNISYRLLEDKDVFHGMNLYLDQFPPDLFAMSTHDRTLAQRIFSRSLTKRMAYHSHVPVLAMHISK
jgi:nucleotide-binding universal stress UspA family protein